MKTNGITRQTQAWQRKETNLAGRRQAMVDAGASRDAAVFATREDQARNNRRFHAVTRNGIKNHQALV